MAKRGSRPIKAAQNWTSALLLAVVAMAVVRSAWATRLDSLTIDEPYHLVAGVSYVRTGDYRLNPEHPPLVKLWVGTFLPERLLPLPPFRPLADKPDERAFAEGAVYRDADPAEIQRRTRIAMFALNGGLLFLLGLLLRREIGEIPALLSVAFLAIDPTVASHLPVAMTDLPVALLSAIAVLSAHRAFRTTRPLDVALAGVALGAALGTKHSALVTAAVVAGIAAAATFRASGAGFSRRRRAAAAGLVFAAAWLLLWGLYRFHFDESREGRDAFNRPLATKLDDVGSPSTKEALRAAERLRAFPRAYLWGLADVTRSAVEGRSFPLFAFGKIHRSTPAWYFAAILGVKLPLGLLLAAVASIGWAAAGRSDAPARGALVVLGVSGVAFLAALAGSNSGYAGVRHALPVFPPLAAVTGAAAGAFAARGGRARFLVLVPFAAAVLPALSVTRPWEFHNLLAGGTEGAFRRLSDEGVDLGQRSLEVASFEREVLRPRGDVPYVVYPMAPEFASRLGLRSRPWVSADPSGTLAGTFLVSAVEVAPSPPWDYEAFRQVEPADRRGNLLVYRGEFRIPWLRAKSLYMEGLSLLYGSPSNLARARDRFAEAARLHPEGWPSALELGNTELRLGRGAEAIAAWELALASTSEDDTGIRSALRDRIARLRASPGSPPDPIRNPWLE